jgi:hypothetical protein
MKKRIFSLVLAVCLTAGLLSGCGSNNADEPEASDEPLTSDAPALDSASTDEEEDGVLADGDVAIPVDEETADEAAEASTAPAEASTPAATATPAATTSAATTSAAVTPAATTPAANTPTASAAPSATPAPSASPVATSVDLEAFYETLFPDPDNAPAMMQLDSDLLDVYYPGLTGISTQQCLVYYPMISAVPVEIALIQVTNSSDVKAVKSILQSRIDTAISDQFAYPMITENWELNSRIAVNGNYLFLVACEDCDSFVSAFDSLF